MGSLGGQSPCVASICVGYFVMQLQDCSFKPSDWAGRADTDGQKWTHFDSGGSIGFFLGTDQNSMVPINLVHIVVGPGRGTWDPKNQKNIKEMKNPTSQQVSG